MMKRIYLFEMIAVVVAAGGCAGTGEHLSQPPIAKPMASERATMAKDQPAKDRPPTGQPQKDNAVYVMASLVDGSQIVGEVALQSLAVRSESIGPVSIPITRLSSLSLSNDGATATIVLTNGDKLQGALGLESISLKTLFGSIVLRRQILRDLRVRYSAAVAEVEWDVLPIPREDRHWGGALAKIENGDLILRGWYARARRICTLPVTIDCTVTVDGGAHQSAYQLYFVPVDWPDDTHPSEGLALSLAHRDGDDEERYRVVIQGLAGPGNWPLVWEAPCQAAPGKPHHLHVVMGVDRWLIQVDDQHYEVPDVKLPLEKFRIQIRGWQPSKVWRVHDFSVH